MSRTAAQRKADKIRSRAWRRANPEQSRAINRRYRAAHPLTPEQLAHKREVNRLWRVKNAAKLKLAQKLRWAEKRSEVNAKRRAKYAADPIRHRARIAAWKAAHPGHCRKFYHRHREKFTGDGPWASRAKKLKRAWRKFTTCQLGPTINDRTEKHGNEGKPALDLGHPRTASPRGVQRARRPPGRL
jgi:hypothetical protein